MDLSQIVPFVLAHAQWIGPALLGAGILVRVLGRALARLVLAVGLLAATGIAYDQYLITHSLVIAGAIVLGAVVVFGILSWAIRGVTLLIAFGLLAGAFYLILYGWVGPAFTSSTMGSLTWAGAAILTEALAGLKTGWLRGIPAAAVAASAVR